MSKENKALEVAKEQEGTTIHDLVDQAKVETNMGSTLAPDTLLEVIHEHWDKVTSKSGMLKLIRKELNFKVSQERCYKAYDEIKKIQPKVEVVEPQAEEK